MRDVKQEQQLFDDHWNRCSARIYATGRSDAVPDELNWPYATLMVHPLNVPFHVNWRSRPEGMPEFLDVPIETDKLGRFRMKVGPNDVWFEVVPTDFKTVLVLELVAVTSAEDPRFANTPAY